MPNRDAIHAQSKLERWPFVMPNMPNRETYLLIWLFIEVFICLYMPFNVFMFIYIFTHREKV